MNVIPLSVNRIEPDVVALEIEVETNEVNAAALSICAELSKTATIRGFRKGKVPPAILLRHVGFDAIRQRVIDHLVPRAYQAAIDKVDVDPIEKAQVEVTQIGENLPLKFRAQMAVKPEVKLGNYMGLEITERRSRITRKNVQNELLRLQEQNATLVETDGRGIRKGDTVVVDVEVWLPDAEGQEASTAEPYSRIEELGFEMDNNDLKPSLDVPLRGVHIDEQVSHTVDYPPDFPEKGLAGKRAELRLRVRSIKEKRLPKLNDEFAQEVGNYRTLADLKEDVARRLRHAAEAAAEKHLTERLLKIVAEGSEVFVPQKMVENEVARERHILETELAKHGGSLGDYVKRSGKAEEEFHAELAERAREDLTRQLVLEAIVKAEKIEVPDEELNTSIEDIARRAEMAPDRLRTQMEEDGSLRQYRLALARRKALKRLVDLAIRVERTAGPDPRPVGDRTG